MDDCDPENGPIDANTNAVAVPRIDAGFVRLALRFLETGDRHTLLQLAGTRAARHIATHARTVSIAGPSPDVPDLIEKLLTSPAIARVDPHEIRARLVWMENNREAQARCWKEAGATLPEAALADATLFLTIGYDIGVAVSGNASLNLAHPHFENDLNELWFYSVHELHHAGWHSYHPMPKLSRVGTTRALVGLIRYFTVMEGLAVHAARSWRAEAGALASDPDYVALLDAQRMDLYEAQFFTLLRGLIGGEPRSLEQGDWDILEPMSTGDRLWYRVGARMVHRIEQTLGRDVLVEASVQGPGKLFDLYAELGMGQR